MANYSIVSNARFTPFSFDQMVKPFQMYGEYYAQEEQLASSLAEQAAEWGKKANEATDPITYQKYKSYESDLNDQSDRLLRQGLTPGLRADLQRMRKRYATDINPIKDAYAWRLQQIQNQAEGKAKGVVYEGDAATTSLDDYMANPTLIYSAADSNAGYTRVANAAQAIARGLSEAKISGKLDSYTKALLIRSGYDANDVTNSVNQAMSDIQGVLNGTLSINSKAGKVVQELLQNESRASGIGDWKSNSAKTEYLSKVSPALYNLIGQSATTPMEDYGARADKSLANQIAAQNNQARLAEAAADKARTFQASMYGGTYDPKTGKISGVDMSQYHKTYRKGSEKSGSGSKGSGTEYAYDRPETYFYDGKAHPIYKDSDGKRVLGEETTGSKKLSAYTSLTIKRSTKNPNNIEIWNGSRQLASYNASDSNKNSGIVYWSPSARKYQARHGGAKLEGILEGATATDIRNLARFVAQNPGSENQYTYGIQEGRIFAIQNSAQRVTKDIEESSEMASDLLSDSITAEPDYGDYGDSSLDPGPGNY